MSTFEKSFKFLKDIKKNNNREWFEKNKPRYQDAKEEFDAFAASLYDDMVKFDESLAGQNPKKLTFRIYRDVRFSKDKTPYKTNMGVAVSPSGKGMGTPGYYFQIEPGGKNFIAAGLYMPEPDQLAKIRQEIDYNGDKLLKIFKDKKFKKYYSKLWDENTLKTAPKGYAKDHPNLHLIKLKSFIVTHDFKDTEVSDKKFTKALIETMKAAKPLNDFLKEAIA